MNRPMDRAAAGWFTHPRATAAFARAGELDPREPYRDEAAIAALLRRCFRAYGLHDAAPLAAVVPAGASVLLKPNWVLHQNQGDGGVDCVVTAPALILAMLRELALTDAASVTIADAPVQGCHFDELVPASFRQAAREALRSTQKLEIIDLRRTILSGRDLAEGVRSEARPVERYALFDLGGRSLLEPVSGPQADFRITMYDPAALARTHAPGRHQFLVAKELFEHDVIFSLPKLKTHRKAGITAGLKNLVGINGNKEYLPHHRLGGSALGGDCYPGRAPLKRLAERALDGANRRIGSRGNTVLRKGAGALVWLHEHLGKLGQRVSSRFDGDPELEGGWHGNDTVWRMSLDLNRILLYGNAAAELAETVQRRVLTVTDAVLCGAGEGPLAPRPLFVGALTLADSAVAADWLHCALLRLDPARIALTRESRRLRDLPLVAPEAELSLCVDGEELALDEIARRVGVDAQPPRGWIGHCEDEAARKSPPRR